MLGFTRNLDTIVSAFEPGFTEKQIRDVEQQIRSDVLKRLENSSSAVERQEVANGSTTVDVHMIKVSKKRLDGYTTISSNTGAARDIGLDKITVSCDATLGVRPDQYLWECNGKP